VTRALVVHLDPVIAAGETAELCALGYLVERCPGPERCACPVLHGRACPLAERADVLVYDIGSLRHAEEQREVGEELRALYADKPIVVVAGDSEEGAFEAIEPSHGVVWLHGPTTAERLALLVEDALSD